MLKLIFNISICFFLSSSLVFSQFDILKKVTDKTEEKFDEGIDKTLEGEQEENEDQQQQTYEQELNEVDKQDDKTKLQNYSKFDFIPGDQVLFFEDFSQDNVGDFPALWNTNSSGEVVTFNNYEGHWFQCGNNGVFLPDINGTFGENFTMEFDLIYSPAAESNLPTFQIDFISGNQDGEAMDAYVPGNGGCAFVIGAYGNSASNWKDQVYGDINSQKDSDFLLNNINQKVHVSFAFQKQRVRFWINETKIFDLPRLLAAGLIIDRLRFYTIETDDQNPYLYISNFRVAVGTPDMRSKLITEGKLVTHGIYFDSGSDQIKAESYGTLKEIASVLKDNSSVKVKIIGHTDSDGADDNNLDLSKRRSASVKNSLVNDFGIEASRLETDGKGESESISDNKTQEGKANNRRVEFIKL